MTAAQKKQLKARGHFLKSIVATGQLGLSANVLAAIDLALTDHELIKIRLNSDDRADRNTQAAQICSVTGAELVQLIGKIAIVYRKNPGWTI